jgi:hypothetical protein
MEEHSITENLNEIKRVCKDFFERPKWAYFFIHFGVCRIGFIVLAGLFAGTLFSAMGKMNPAMSSMGIFWNNNGCRLFSSPLFIFSSILFKQVCFKC